MPKRREKPPPEGKGLRCPRCGCAHLPVLYVRPVSGERSMRVRECRACSHHVRTFEIVRK